MILVLDNYDSFTYNLVHQFGVAGAEARVFRNDEITLDAIAGLRPSGIVLSPGPCTPRESGVCLDVVAAALAGRPPFDVPLFGVCLGHQAIAEVAGATVGRARRLMHGKASPIRHDGEGVFAGMPNPFSAIRYHSLAIMRETLPPEFVVSATSDGDDEIMGIRHRGLPIEGVQFHPESILTEMGERIAANFVARVQARERATVPA